MQDPPMQHRTTFTLNKAHYSECFEESRKVSPVTNSQRYQKAAILFFLALVLSQTTVDGYVTGFFFMLAIIDALSVYYARGWWLARQLISRASGGEVTLLINGQGIEIQSEYVNQQLLWPDIAEIKQTDRGLIVYPVAGGQSYISKHSLTDDVTAFILSHNKNE
ncbi:YcxB family protein [Sinobacterium norvegicum]|nr:YcxB family protein [Sinobacterium norvegicum]